MSDLFKLPDHMAIAFFANLAHFKTRYPKAVVAFGTPADWNKERKAKKPDKRYPEGLPHRPYDVYLTTDDSIGEPGQFSAHRDAPDLVLGLLECIVEIENKVKAWNEEKDQIKADKKAKK